MKFHVRNSKFEDGRLVKLAAGMRRGAARDHGTQLVNIRIQLVPPSLLTRVPTRPEIMAPLMSVSK